MFRKIHSNRDPQDTILTQLRAEFKPYFERSSAIVKNRLQRKPKTFFILMIVLMAFSAVISFTICRNKEPVEKIGAIPKENKVNAVSDGFSQILTTAATIKQGLTLKHQIDSLSTKKTLSKTDSQTLINDLDKIHQLNKPHNP